MLQFRRKAEHKPAPRLPDVGVKIILNSTKKASTNGAKLTRRSYKNSRPGQAHDDEALPTLRPGHALPPAKSVDNPDLLPMTTIMSREPSGDGSAIPAISHLVVKDNPETLRKIATYLEGD